MIFERDLAWVRRVFVHFTSLADIAFSCLMCLEAFDCFLDYALLEGNSRQARFELRVHAFQSEKSVLNLEAGDQVKLQS